MEYVSSNGDDVMQKFTRLCSVLGLSISLALIPMSAANADTTPLIEALSAGGSGELPSLAPLLEKVVPAVVNISVNGKKSLRNDMMEIPEQFRFFFPEMPRERAFKALGSGVVIDASKGTVITNFHVVDGADEIKVTLHDGRVIKAKKIGEDQQTDIAVLELEKKDNLTAIPFSNSDKLRVGDFVIAIGNPFGLGQTVTSGIVSALGRSGLNIENYENFIQTDAAINSGNSGGALLNLRGELVGINTAILGKAGGNIGIGFAIPANMVKSTADQLIKQGKVKRGMLGILGTEVTEDLAKNFDYKNVNGAFVNEVMKGSAADKAGIKSGDILTSINGSPISNFGQLRAKIATLGAGAKIKLGIFRDGKSFETDVVLDSSAEAGGAVSKSMSPLFEGATLGNNTDDDKGGIVVKSVASDSPAENLGLKKGDIIVEVNKKEVKTVDDLENALKEKDSFIALRIIRGNAVIYITRSF